MNFRHNCLKVPISGVKVLEEGEIGNIALHGLDMVLNWPSACNRAHVSLTFHFSALEVLL
jgi:hypothetical protein